MESVFESKNKINIPVNNENPTLFTFYLLLFTLNQFLFSTVYRQKKLRP